MGVETGPAVVGRLWSATGVGYSAVGSVVQVAAALASAANAGSVLVGPATRAATEGVFEWGPPGAEGGAAAAMDAAHLQRSKPGGTHRRGLATRTPLVGREAELAALDEVLHRTTSGDGSVVFLVAEPGLGKTRLVSEARNRFMGWVGTGTGRLPLWLEGRCVSYASSTPYGLFRQLLSAWIAIGPGEPEEVVRPAFERAMRAMFAGDADEAVFLARYARAAWQRSLGGVPAQPGGPAMGDVRVREQARRARRTKRTDCTRLRRFALGRPHLAPLDRRTGEAHGACTATPPRHPET